MAHLFAHDSTYGRPDADVARDGDTLLVDGGKMRAAAAGVARF